ncbi:MAG: phenylalanine--tRNA ligase subunit beta [Candidatus Pacebacteria bacterium]|nr:phenylalanine--tRNA ligase subunit beta [Candidatus Paceibacterota bacterium]
MKISYKWLEEYVDINVTPEKLAELLTMHCFEVENIIYQGKGLEDVVVGEVLEKEKHPDADKLSVVKVKISDNEISEIVCGAPNIAIGQKVLVAKLGAEIPCGLKIEKRKVRGVESSGMVCAEDELGLGENHEGIMVLDEKSKVGTLAQDILGLDDVIFEIDILPNRAHDCLSHLGVAREVAVLLESKIKNQKSNMDLRISNSSKELEVKIKNEELCRRYSAVIINSVKIKESPSWLKNRLESCDIRSINNIVDITNFVMLSIGQPMHAFDADKLNGKIIVRNAKKGEKIVALDENKYELTENDLVIADEKNPIAIAGVMGGLETAVDENTKNIIFEAANFQGTNIRKTSSRLKLSSESSYRFEREIDPEIITSAIEMAVNLTKELSSGDIKDSVTDIYPSPEKRRNIKFNFSRIENLLGIEIEKEKVFSILISLGFEVSQNDDEIEVLVPTFRRDVEKANDIIEEIGRINGYEMIEEVFANVPMKSVIQDKTLLMEKDIRKTLEGLGFFEVYNYSFLGEKEISGVQLKIEDHLELQNPLSEEFMFMRTSLLPDLLNNTRDNLKHRDSFKLFELGRIYLKNSKDNVDERKILSGIMVSKNQKETLFYDAKEQLELILEKIGVERLSYRKIENPESFWHKGRSAEILSKKKVIGKIGEIHPIVLNNFDLTSKVIYFEIYIEELVSFYGEIKKYQKINKFPEVELDLSVVFNESVQWGEIKKAINSTSNNLIQGIEPFDIYRGENLGENKKSIAFRISYQAEDRTLTDEEVKTIQDEIIIKLEKLGGEVRK